MSREPTRYHFTDDHPVSMTTAEGQVKIGKGWLAISEAEYTALRSPSPDTDAPALWDKMRVLSKTHPRGSELTDYADKFEAATTGFYSDPQTVDVRKLMGAWARARRLWGECSGEPLI